MYYYYLEHNKTLKHNSILNIFEDYQALSQFKSSFLHCTLNEPIERLNPLKGLSFRMIVVCITKIVSLKYEPWMVPA